MFTNLRMVNFKSWADTGDVRLAPLTVLFGGNSTGKSGLLQMLLLLKQTTEARDRNVVLQTGIDYREKDYVRLGTLSDISHFDSTEMELTIGWNWPENERSLPFPKLDKPRNSSVRSLEFNTRIRTQRTSTQLLSFTYQQGSDEQEQVKASLKPGALLGYKLDIDLGPHGGELKPRFDGDSNAALADSGKCYSFPPEAKRLFSSATYFLDDLEWKLEEQFRRLYYLGPHREFPHRAYYWAGERPDDVGATGENAVPAILAADLGGSVLQHLIQMNLATSFEVRPLTDEDPLFRVYLRLQEKSCEVLLPDVGFGISQVLPVLVLCLYAPEHSTIILEHPDLHLHPSAQAALADFLIDVMKQRNVQIIVESHSEHLLRRLQRRTAEEALSSNDVALYFCDIQDGVSNLEELELNEFGEISNWPDDFFGDMLGDVIETMESGLNRQSVADA